MAEILPILFVFWKFKKSKSRSEFNGPLASQKLIGLLQIHFSGAGRWKRLGRPVVIGGDNLPSPVGIGLTDPPNIGRASGPPGSGTTVIM